MYYSRPVKKMNDTLLDLMQPLEPFSDRTRVRTPRMLINCIGIDPPTWAR